MRVHIALGRFIAAAVILLVGMIIGSSIPLSSGVASTGEAVVGTVSPSDEASRKEEPTGEPVAAFFKERLQQQATAEAKSREQRQELRLVVVAGEKAHEPKSLSDKGEAEQLAGALQLQDIVPRENSLAATANTIAQSHGPVATSTIEGVFDVNKVLVEAAVEAAKMAAGVPPTPAPPKKPKAAAKATQEKKPAGVVEI